MRAPSFWRTVAATADGRAEGSHPAARVTASHAPHRFGPFTLSAAERVVWRAGKPVALAPKAIDVLLVLLVEPERVVAKRELIEAVWPEGLVDEANLTQTMYVLRLFFREQNTTISIENVPKRGYRLIVPKDAAPEGPDPGDDSEPPGPRPMWRLTRPTWSGAE